MFYNYIYTETNKHLHIEQKVGDSIFIGRKYQLVGFLAARISLYFLLGRTGMICPHLSGKKKPPPGPCLVRDTECPLPLPLPLPFFTNKY